MGSGGASPCSVRLGRSEARTLRAVQAVVVVAREEGGVEVVSEMVGPEAAMEAVVV